MTFVQQLTLSALVGALLAYGAFQLLDVGTMSGPNCPGKDPAWIGFCDKAPDRQ